MAPPALKLGTRRSALARAQSAAVAAELMRRHPGLAVELVGIDTRGDQILDAPLSSVEGKAFFTDELDAALLGGRVDLTVHSYKDLSLERPARLLLAAVPAREPPHDLVVYAPDVPERLAAGHELLIGSSSPRRASFVPPFLERALPRRGADRRALGRVRLVDLRGNVDTRLRRLHEPRGAPRHLDGVVLAFAGLARLWADPAGQSLLRTLLAPLPRMLLPLSECPTAPAQGALAIECRREDGATAGLLGALEHAPTRRAVEAERALLALRGGGCHQRFGATQLELPGIGTLLYERADADPEHGASAPHSAPPRWIPVAALAAIGGAVRAWDGARAAPGRIEPLAAGLARCDQRLPQARALFVAHRRAWPEGAAGRIDRRAHVWVPGVETWYALAERGQWVEGCTDGLGFAALQPLLDEPLLELPARAEWLVLTHEEAAAGWSEGEIIATYRHVRATDGDEAAGAPDSDITHVYWSSSAQFDRWGARLGEGVQHACGPGKTYEHLRRAGVQNLQLFPQPAHWRQWLGL